METRRRSRLNSDSKSVTDSEVQSQGNLEKINEDQALTSCNSPAYATRSRKVITDNVSNLAKSLRPHRVTRGSESETTSTSSSPARKIFSSQESPSIKLGSTNKGNGPKGDSNTETVGRRTLRTRIIDSTSQEKKDLTNNMGINLTTETDKSSPTKTPKSYEKLSVEPQNNSPTVSPQKPVDGVNKINTSGEINKFKNTRPKPIIEFPKFSVVLEKCSPEKIAKLTSTDRNKTPIKKHRSYEDYIGNLLSDTNEDSFETMVKNRSSNICPYDGLREKEDDESTVELNIVETEVEEKDAPTLYVAPRKTNNDDGLINKSDNNVIEIIDLEDEDEENTTVVEANNSVQQKSPEYNDSDSKNTENKQEPDIKTSVNLSQSVIKDTDSEDSSNYEPTVEESVESKLKLSKDNDNDSTNDEPMVKYTVKSKQLDSENEESTEDEPDLHKSEEQISNEQGGKNKETMKVEAAVSLNSGELKIKSNSTKKDKDSEDNTTDEEATVKKSVQNTQEEKFEQRIRTDEEESSDDTIEVESAVNISIGSKTKQEDKDSNEESTEDEPMIQKPEQHDEESSEDESKKPVNITNESKQRISKNEEDKLSERAIYKDQINNAKQELADIIDGDDAEEDEKIHENSSEDTDEIKDIKKRIKKVKKSLSKIDGKSKQKNAKDDDSDENSTDEEKLNFLQSLVGSDTDSKDSIESINGSASEKEEVESDNKDSIESINGSASEKEEVNSDDIDSNESINGSSSEAEENSDDSAEIQSSSIEEIRLRIDTDDTDEDLGVAVDKNDVYSTNDLVKVNLTNNYTVNLKKPLGIDNSDSDSDYDFTNVKKPIIKKKLSKKEFIENYKKEMKNKKIHPVAQSLIDMMEKQKKTNNVEKKQEIQEKKPTNDKTKKVSPVKKRQVETNSSSESEEDIEEEEASAKISAKKPTTLRVNKDLLKKRKLHASSESEDDVEEEESAKSTEKKSTTVKDIKELFKKHNELNKPTKKFKQWNVANIETDFWGNEVKKSTTSNKILHSKQKNKDDSNEKKLNEKLIEIRQWNISKANKNIKKGTSTSNDWIVSNTGTPETEESDVDDNNKKTKVRKTLKRTREDNDKMEAATTKVKKYKKEKNLKAEQNLESSNLNYEKIQKKKEKLPSKYVKYRGKSVTKFLFPDPKTFDYARFNEITSRTKDWFIGNRFSSNNQFEKNAKKANILNGKKEYLEKNKTNNRNKQK